jgi:hypothetical protein
VVAAAVVAGGLLPAGGCTTSSDAGRPDVGMSGMSGMPGMTGMGSMPGMGEVSSAPTTPALAAAAADGTGLSGTLHGYTLVASTPSVAAGSSGTYAFRITGPNGKTVMRYQPYEGAFVNCYVIRSDLSEFHYLQPAMHQDGTWTAALPSLPAGSYRAFVTFAAPDASEGTPLVYQLSSPFTVPGTAVTGPATTSAPAPGATATADVDGYDVVVSGAPQAGVSGPLTVSVAKGGKPVVSFQRFLDSYVHLTAFHAGDLAFAHIFTLGGVQQGGGAMTAEALFPESGTWRVFAQFELSGYVHTAALSIVVP